MWQHAAKYNKMDRMGPADRRLETHGLDCVASSGECIRNGQECYLI
jgi:hypothetical protein